MEGIIFNELLAVNGVVNVLQFKNLPHEEVVKKVTHADHCNYGYGVVDRLREKIFEPGEDCAPLPARPPCACTQRSPQMLARKLIISPAHRRAVDHEHGHYRREAHRELGGQEVPLREP